MAPQQSKSKSKDKSLSKSAKEKQKASSKPARSTNIGSSSAASAYNPISGTYHSLEVSSDVSSPTVPDNGLFRNINETDEHSISQYENVIEYDSVSNNDSCSGESEDPKEKVAVSTSRQETLPVSDSYRREKIRMENEKKHQRHRERRAQELHERCSGYLMSRKLETLSQQLVAMGFLPERVTLALLLNEGRVEESVTWLLNVNEEEAQDTDSNLGNGCNLKIDISEELAQISEIEERYKCSKQEVERIIVACEGDLKKAEVTLRAQKQELLAAPSKPEEASDPKNLVKPQEKPPAAITIQQSKKGQDFNYRKPAVVIPLHSDPGNRSIRSLKESPTKLSEKRWTTRGSSFSVPVTPNMEAAPQSFRVEAQNRGVVNEGKNTKQGVVKEPVILMQRPESINVKHNAVSSINASPPGTAGLYANNSSKDEKIRSNGKLENNYSMGSLGSENQNSGINHKVPYRDPYEFKPMDSALAGLGSSWNKMGESSPSHVVSSDPGGSWNTMNASSVPFSAASSHGLFSGWNSGSTLGSSTNVDWSTEGSMPVCDYTSIDWTLDTTLTTPKSHGLFLGLSTAFNKDSSIMNQGAVNDIYMSRLQHGMAAEAASAGSREWTSPFAGYDIFSFPRHFVTSPSP